MPTLPDDIVTIENGIAAWVVTGSLLDADHVWWVGKGQPRDNGPYITIKIIADEAGMGWSEWEDAPVPQDGAELVQKARASVAWTLSIQAFAGETTGALSPRARLARVRAVSELEEVKEALNVAGVGLGRIGVIGDVGSARGAALFEPRAVMNAVVFLASEVAATGTYIEKVETTGAVFDTREQAEAAILPDT